MLLLNNNSLLVAKNQFLINNIKYMTNINIVENVENTDLNFWDLYFSIRNNMLEIPTIIDENRNKVWDKNALGFSIFDKEQKNIIPLFITQYNAGHKILNLGPGAGTQVKRFIDSGKFRSLDGKVFLADVELYSQLKMATKNWKKKYKEEITTADGRKAMAIYPVHSFKSGKTQDEFDIEQMINWLDQPIILEVIKKRFNLVKVI